MFHSKKFATPVAAVFAASVLSLASSSAIAAVVCNNTGFAIPQTGDGIYFNLVTGATGTTGGAVDGFDLNLYGTTRLQAYSGADVSENNALLGTVVAGVNNDLYTVLAAGQPIGAASSWTSESGAMTNFNVGVTGAFVGIKFDNEATGAVNFGWLQITTTGPNGYPANVTAYCYDNTGADINAGTTPVSLQNFSVD
ncbi:MAG TPA: hypothetical protein VM555_04000 [Tahibacter sp.]|jgi:hypothetical protein|nr:hypothetical protein [Tahibacter sp.]